MNFDKLLNYILLHYLSFNRRNFHFIIIVEQLFMLAHHTPIYLFHTEKCVGSRTADEDKNVL